VGGNVGGVWGTSNIDIPRYPSNFDIKETSVVGGGQVGCNYQVNQFVFGIEGDFEGMSLKGDHLSGGSGGERFLVDWDWSASIRGRFGIANNNWLFYVTGGGAWANLNAANFRPTIFADVSGTFSGWVVGGGIEYGFVRTGSSGLSICMRKMTAAVPFSSVRSILIYVLTLSAPV
jgi:outer membrane immunogenic protein